MSDHLRSSIMHQSNQDDQSCYSKYNQGFVICCAEKCGGIFSVYRFSFALFVFSITMFLLTCKKSVFASKIHKRYWLIKILYVTSILISSIFISNEIMLIYRDISRYLSVPFLFLQILLLIDSAYKCNDKCIELDESENKCIPWKYALITLSSLLYIACTAIFVILFAQLGNHHELEKTIMIITICTSILLSIVSMSKYAPHGTIITSAFVTTYTTYLCYSAVMSFSNENTNSPENNIDLFMGLVITSISMASLTWGMTGSKDVVLGKTSLLENEEIETNETKESWGYFHIMMSLCALYMCMLLTNWSSNTDDQIISTREKELHNFWAKIWSQWLCFILYGWTLLAPYLLRNYRDFGIEFDI